MNTEGERQRVEERSSGLVCVLLPLQHCVFFCNAVIYELGIFLGMTFEGCFPPSSLANFIWMYSQGEI